MADPLDDAFALGPASPLASVTNASPPSAPPAPADKYQQRMDMLYDRQQQTIDRVERSADRESQIYDEREKALAPIRQRQERLAEMPLPEPPKMQEPPKTPARQDQHDDETWLMASALLGSLAGAFTRRHQTNALAAFSGAMEGYNEGSRQKFDQNMKIWEAENKRTQEANKTAMDHYQSILENRKLTNDQMSVELQMAAARYDDKAMAAAARTKNATVIAQLYDKQAEAAGRMKTASDSLSQRYADMQRRERLEILKMQMRAVGANTPEQMVATIDAIGQYRAAPIAGKAGTAIMQEVYARYPDYDQGTWLEHKLKAQIPARVEGAAETAEARLTATRGAQMDLIMRTAKPAIQQAANASAAVPRTTFVPLNELFQMTEASIGDPALRTFKIANQQLAEAWAKAMNPSGQMTVAYFQTAKELLMTADSPEAYRAVLIQLNQYLDREMTSIQAAREHKPAPPITFPEEQHSTRAKDVGNVARQKEEELEERSGLRLWDQGEFQPRQLLPEWARTPKWLRDKIYVPPSERSKADMPVLPPGWTVEQVK